MIRRLVLLLALAALATLSSTPARAAAGFDTYDAVDAVELDSAFLVVTGVLTGQTAQVTRSYFFGSGDTDGRMRTCAKLAVLVMSKPGKFQLAMRDSGSSVGACKVILRTP
ncbi:MAG TPA: hypothetical protein VLM79_26080 [Kofleriaceae bacterium]|nr:hypothetical protein [Kofleriaceae bacterium]